MKNSAGYIYPLKTTLLDGTPVLIRPVQANDKPLFSSALQDLSNEDRYNRFFKPVTELTENMLRQLTEIDHIDEEAIAALDLSVKPPTPMGVARYVRSDEKPETAEVAVTVVSSCHGRGLGTLLLALLATRAIENGITKFSAVVLQGNTKMQTLFDKMGPLSKQSNRGTLDYTIPLHADPKNYPSTAVGEVFRDVSNHNLFKGAA